MKWTLVFWFWLGTKLALDIATASFSWHRIKKLLISSGYMSSITMYISAQWCLQYIGLQLHVCVWISCSTARSSVNEHFQLQVLQQSSSSQQQNRPILLALWNVLSKHSCLRNHTPRHYIIATPHFTQTVLTFTPQSTLSCDLVPLSLNLPLAATRLCKTLVHTHWFSDALSCTLSRTIPSLFFSRPYLALYTWAQFSS